MPTRITHFGGRMQTGDSQLQPLLARVHLRQALLSSQQEAGDQDTEPSHDSYEEARPKSVITDLQSHRAELGDLEPWQRAEIASTIGIPDAYLEEFAADDDMVVRAASSANPGLTNDLREQIILDIISVYSSDLDEDGEALNYIKEAVLLLSDQEGLKRLAESLQRFDEADCADWWVAPNIRMQVAAHDLCPDDIWMQLLEDESSLDWGEGEHVWHGILEGKRQPPPESEARLEERLYEALLSEDSDLHRLVARYRYTPPSLLVELAAIGGVDRELLANPALPEHFRVSLDWMAQAPVLARQLVARGVDSESEWIFPFLAHDYDAGVRASTAANPATPLQILQRLATDPELVVRRETWGNPSSNDAVKKSAIKLGI